ncbi:bacillithiol biosynthesis cysteine-adding enzyme BshC [Halalkalibacter sp. APA_J-10(15)]|uniref:bacillithiol biosynthesis cysteine-adding enzyme BshC n=1 Tax=unclassified Halalkalibacter TaxID=2893063 RepID=UPI001FF63F54|nr:bacillithiol biosynthesis cysteine-adding enzyme BshC [Halalkalibacter sp. APA_J-10(15)]MCK0470652.1 bacillithiol biosynthesis cysteine-adding enzyme BshC [Halalkalibacter sp. APA_J-10(15)]
MNVEELDLTINRFTDDYLAYKEQATIFFDYLMQDKDVFKKRLDHIQTREFKREELFTYFKKSYKVLPNHDEAMNQIEKFKDSKSVVVVGGQQAGLLTGPLYTIYKAMTIVALAKQQERELGIGVIPIFWIAGEDHDLDEIRFVYKQQGLRWKKHFYDTGSSNTSATNVILDHAQMGEWVEGIFATLPETAFTCDLFQKVSDYVKQSNTMVDFFRNIMHWFFAEQGLLLLDAHDPLIRQMEKGYFKQLIDQVDCLQVAQQKGDHEFNQSGYGEPIDTEPTNAHLFLEVNGERKRLDFEDGLFLVQGTDVTYSKADLLYLLDQHPERFSNNVVTRPLMQEWLLPVLAFVGGPGEIAYWATLKPVFKLFALKIPPVLLRYQVTFIPTQVSKWLSEHNYKATPFLKGEMKTLRDQWLENVNPYPITEVVGNVREQVRSQHETIRDLAAEMDQTIYHLSEKNINMIEQQLSFIENKMKKFVRQTHEEALAKFVEAEHWLSPINKQQERIIHPFVLMNVIGECGFKKWLSMELSFSRKHKLLYL